MASFVPRHQQTLVDQHLYTEARQTEVACQDCLARVGVKKNSAHHTAIQWSAQAVASCPELSRLAAAPGGRTLHLGCPRLQASIDQATREGEIPLGAEDGY